MVIFCVFVTPSVWQLNKYGSPVKIWMKPKRMIMHSASNLEAVNRSWTLVAALTLIQFTNVREAAGDKKHKEGDLEVCRLMASS